MKSYKLVRTETIEKMLGSFTDVMEYQKFGLDVNQLSQELQYLGLKMVRDHEKVDKFLAKQIFTFAMFCRDNFELIQAIVGAVDYRVVSDDEMKILTEEGQLEEEWD